MIRGEARRAFARVSCWIVDDAMVVPRASSRWTMSRFIATAIFKRRSRKLLPTSRPRVFSGTISPSRIFKRLNVDEKPCRSVPTRRRKVWVPCSPSGASFVSSQSRVATGSRAKSSHSESDAALAMIAIVSSPPADDVDVTDACFTCCSCSTPMITLRRSRSAPISSPSPRPTASRSPLRVRSRSPGEPTMAVARPTGTTPAMSSTPASAAWTFAYDATSPRSSVPRPMPPKSAS
jgi:hypothetical protein